MCLRTFEVREVPDMALESLLGHSYEGLSSEEHCQFGIDYQAIFATSFRLYPHNTSLFPTSKLSQPALVTSSIDTKTAWWDQEEVREESYDQEKTCLRIQFASDFSLKELASP